MRADPDVGVVFDYDKAEKLADPLYSDIESSGGGFHSFLSTPFNQHVWRTMPLAKEYPNGIHFNIKIDSMEGSFRPLVCLKSNVLLKKNADETYTIK